MKKEEYKTTIGMEVHAELKTKTKMFCSCRNNPDEEKPNHNICPVCMAHPGTLPVINKEAVKSVLKVGVALGSDLADFTEFDRKNYFYPDIPKGFQISQYKYPLVSGGELKGVKITRVHLEEDTASSLHNGDYSLINFNRAGVPLMELVTEPVITSAEEAGAFARELQLLFRYLGVSDANMEKGEMRVEANISVSKTDKLGTKVEVKNLNSFKVVEKAIAYEVNRQIEALKKGELILQETRGWDDNKGVTFSQRIKEGSDDYRYFPEPDLPKLKISEIPEFSFENLKKEIPELPQEKRERYLKVFALDKNSVEIYINDSELGIFFEEVASFFGDDFEAIKLASNYLSSDLLGLFKNDLNAKNKFGLISKDSFVQLIGLVKKGEISSRGAKNILAIMYQQGGMAEDIAKKENLFQQNNEEELGKIIDKVILENPAVVEEYKNGKQAVLGFLVGQAMQASGSSANPKKISELLIKNLSE